MAKHATDEEKSLWKDIIGDGKKDLGNPALQKEILDDYEQEHPANESKPGRQRGKGFFKRLS
eukprot:9616012-Lingulodinium_polyedra.AAC.1